MLDNDDIVSLLSSQSRRLNAVENLKTLVKTYSLKGLNIDFEPTGNVSPQVRDSFTLFVEELSQALNKDRLSGVELSVDIYPTLYGKQRLWDLPRIAPHLSYVVIMGYDYHYRGSDTAGPVSPLRGATNHFNDDLATNLGEISKLIPSNKIVLGLPFYGYRWATTTSDLYSPTIGSGITAPLKDIEELIKEDPSTLHWDRNSLTPYLVLETKSKISQIYFENDLSLGLKLDLVVTSGYQGIAIWALGYEPENSSLWQTISHKLNSQ
jgi:spore germination protein YaaH